MPQIHEYETLVSEVLPRRVKIFESLQPGMLLEKLPPSWKDYHDQLNIKGRISLLRNLLDTSKLRRRIEFREKGLHP